MDKEKAAVSCFMEDLRQIIGVGIPRDNPKPTVIPGNKAELSVKAVKKKNPKSKKIFDLPVEEVKAEVSPI
jgi:hypothetical protein